MQVLLAATLVLGAIGVALDVILRGAVGSELAANATIWILVAVYPAHRSLKRWDAAHAGI